MNLRKCKGCGAKEIYLSRRGFCLSCSKKHILNLSSQMKKKKGKYYNRWKKGVLKYIKSGTPKK